MTLFILHYQLAADYIECSQPHREAHIRHVATAASNGDMVIGGAIGMPPTAAVYVFQHEDAAHLFATTDPYVTGSVTKAWTVSPWLPIVGPGAENR